MVKAVTWWGKPVKQSVSEINVNVRPFSYSQVMTIKTFGYARVSTADQNPTSQEDALKAAGAGDIYLDHFTGTNASRPELDKLLAQLRAGDTLMVTRLDRLGRSTRDLLDLVTKLDKISVNLKVLEQQIDTGSAEGRLFFTMIAAFAEFEREIMRARTLDGLAAARARGRNGGRKSALTASQAEIARTLVNSGKPFTQVAADLGVSRPTIYRAVRADI